MVVCQEGRYTAPTKRGRPSLLVMTKRKGRSSTNSTSSSGDIPFPGRGAAFGVGSHLGIIGLFQSIVLRRRAAPEKENSTGGHGQKKGAAHQRKNPFLWKLHRKHLFSDLLDERNRQRFQKKGCPSVFRRGRSDQIIWRRSRSAIRVRMAAASERRMGEAGW